MDGVDGHRGTRAQHSQGGHDGIARGCERHRGVEGRGGLACRTDAGRTHRRGLVLASPGAGPHVDLAVPVAGHLQGQQGGRAEAEEAQPATGLDAAHLERAVADDTAAEEGSSLKVGKPVRHVQGEVGAHRHPGGEAAIEIPAGEAGIRAEVLAVGRAPVAGPTRRRQPGDAHAVAHGPAGDVETDPLHPADGLVAGHDGQSPRGQVTLHDLEVRAADGAGGDRHDELPWLGLRVGQVQVLERSVRHWRGTGQALGSHRFTVDRCRVLRAGASVGPLVVTDFIDHQAGFNRLDAPTLRL